MDKENEDEKSLTFTVRAAHELQVEKEKVFQEEKSKLEKDIGQQKHYVGELEKHIKIYKENISKQQENIAQILCSLDVAINKDGMKNHLVSYNLSYDVNNWNEGVKGLSLTSKNLRGNLVKAIEGIKYSNEKSRLSGKLREGEKNMNGMIDQISTLAYKLGDAEEKLRQMIEIKNMTQEDIHSHVVTMTESIFMQEEASDVIEMLECRDAQTFEYAKKDIALNKRLLELEGDLEQQRRNLESEIMDLKVKDQEIGQIKQKMNENFDEMDELAEKLQILEAQMCDPGRNLSLALRARLENVGINPMELEDLIEFFEVFEMEGEGEERNHMRMYQKEIFEEIIYVIGQTQLIENMEMQLMPKGRKSVRHERRNSQMTTGGENSDELVNKRLEFTEKLIYYKTKRNEYEKKLMINKRLSFNELMKESLEGADFNVKRIVEGVVLEIVGQNYSIWHTHSLIKEDLVTIQNEIMEMEENLEMLSGKVRSNEESLRNRKKEVGSKAKEIEAIRGELGKLEESQGEIDRFEEEEDSFYEQGYTEQLLERLEVQTRRGHSLIKLKNNFTKLKNKPKDWKKMKDEIMHAEELITRMEGYRGKTTAKIEHELASGVKRVKGQIIEYKMKVNLVQRELLLSFEQLGGVLRELENELYGRYKDDEGVIYDVCNQIIVCKGYLNDLMKELKAQIIHGLTKNQLTFLEVNELKRIKETTEKDSRRIHEEDIKYIFIMEGCLESLRIKLNKMKEKLGSCENEIEKYRNFYEISHELLKDKVQAGKESNRNLSMSLLSVPRDNANSKPASPTPIPSLVLNPRDLNVLGETEKNITKFDTTQENEKPVIEQVYQIEGDFSSPKMYQGDTNWLKGVEVPTLDSSSTTKTQSSNSVNFTSVRSPVSIEKRVLSHDMSSKNLVLGGETKKHHPQEKGMKNLYVDEEEMKSLMEKFEKGFNVLKRFSENNKVEEKVSVTLSMKGKSKPKRDLKGYGKRILKLNIKEKSLDVLKVGVMGTRNVVEYKYGWETLKQVVIGSKTMQEIKERQRDKENTRDLETIKEVQGVEDGDEEKEMLNVAIDVLSKGRIDFLMSDVEQVLALWNFVHVKLKN